MYMESRHQPSIVRQNGLQAESVSAIADATGHTNPSALVIQLKDFIREEVGHQLSLLPHSQELVSTLPPAVQQAIRAEISDALTPVRPPAPVTASLFFVDYPPLFASPTAPLSYADDPSLVTPAPLNFAAAVARPPPPSYAVSPPTQRVPSAPFPRPSPQMITAVVCHVLLPPLQMACIAGPTEHAPSLCRYPKQIDISPTLFLLKKPRPPLGYWTLQPAWDHTSKVTLSSPSTIKEQQPSRLPCGLGGCATTLSRNMLAFTMQVSAKYSLFSKKCSNYCLVQLPSPQCCLAMLSECVHAIQSLLLLSGDVETNPGPSIADVFAELQKLTVGQSTLITEVQGLKNQLSCTDATLTDLSKRIMELEQHYQALIPLRSELETVYATTSETGRLVSSLESRIEDADNRSRRSNLILYGIPDPNPPETFAQSEKLFIDNIQKHMNISLDPKEIERAHRLGRYSPRRNRPIIAKLAFYKTKELVLSNGRKLKGSNCSIGEDFSPAVRNARKHLVLFGKSKATPFKLRFKTLVIGSKRYEYDESSKTVKEIH
ncbi:uncharacterized protein LOC142584539 [Dermacentor variabilis]|uniref:uncharacterized protein LOC142584539 n=1 Tax=Dermacentor variabilis TaxID=34621 RepID=UPI003F5BF42A